MRSNRQIVRKADFENANLVTSGLLNPEQANRFIRILIEQPTLIREVRTVEMTSPSREINKIQFDRRILRAASSATALANAAVDVTTAFDPTDSPHPPGHGLARAKPLTEKITLTTSEVIAQVNLPYDVIEDNIERGSIGQQRGVEGTNAGGGFVDTIMQLMAERAALDFEELAISGDTALGTSDPYLDLQDGYLKRAVGANGNILDVAGATVSKDMFRDAKKTMPDPYLRDLASMRHYVSMDQETEYRDTVASRGTGLGDATLEGNSSLRAFGVSIVPVSLMPDSKGLFCNPLNLLWGIQRQVTMEFDKDIEARVLKIVISARIATQIEEVRGTVEYINIG